MYSATLRPAGFHPTVSIRVNTTTGCGCALFALLELPSAVLADRFQLAQLHLDRRLGSPILSDIDADPKTSLRVAGTSASDLESPESRAGPTSVLVRLAAPDPRAHGLVEMELPLHVRYLDPVEHRWGHDGRRADLRQLELPHPLVFYACTPGELPPPNLHSCSPSSLPSAPPDSARSIHYLSSSPLCPPTLPPLMLTLPTGVLADLPLVEATNFVVVCAGALWLAWVALAKRRRRNKVE